MTIFVHTWAAPGDIPEIQPERSAPALGAREMPPDVVSQRSKKLRAKALQTPGWKLVHGDTAVVRGDLQPSHLKEISVLASELQVMMRQVLGSNETAPFKVSVRVFAENQDYRRAAASAGASNAESYYMPPTAEIVMHFGTYPTRESFLRAFAHEFAHAYMDRAFGKTGPLWLAEGVAEWFSNLQWRGDILVPGGLNWYTIAPLRESKSDLSLRRLFGMPREGMYGMYFRRYYAEAWSVVDFVMETMPYRSLARLIQGEMDPAELLDREEEWKRHVEMTLEAALGR